MRWLCTLSGSNGIVVDSISDHQIRQFQHFSWYTLRLVPTFGIFEDSVTIKMIAFGLLKCWINSQRKDTSVDFLEVEDHSSEYATSKWNCKCNSDPSPCWTAMFCLVWRTPSCQPWHLWTILQNTVLLDLFLQFYNFFWFTRWTQKPPQYETMTPSTRRHIIISYRFFLRNAFYIYIN